MTAPWPACPLHLPLHFLQVFVVAALKVSGLWSVALISQSWLFIVFLLFSPSPHPQLSEADGCPPPGLFVGGFFLV